MTNQFGRTCSGHDDSFRLILYVDDTGNAEPVWNARNGQAPTNLIGRTGHLMTRSCRGVPAPRYVPPIGSLAIIPLTFERIVSCISMHLDDHWDEVADHPIIGTMSRDTAARFIANGRYHEDRGFIIQVDEKAHRSFEERAAGFIVREPDNHISPCIKGQTGERCDGCFMVDEVMDRTNMLRMSDFSTPPCVHDRPDQMDDPVPPPDRSPWSGGDEPSVETHSIAPECCLSIQECCEPSRPEKDLPAVRLVSDSQGLHPTSGTMRRQPPGQMQPQGQRQERRDGRERGQARNDPGQKSAATARPQRR